MMLSDLQKSRLLTAWAAGQEQAGAPLHDVLSIGVDATWAEQGTLLEPKTIPVCWPRELERLRRILATVMLIDATMGGRLAEWIAEIERAVNAAARSDGEMAGEVTL